LAEQAADKEIGVNNSDDFMLQYFSPFPAPLLHVPQSQPH
jgi:hypothetical protein